MLDDLRHHHLSVTRPTRGGIGDQDVVVQSPIVRRDEAHAAVTPIAPDYPVGVPLQHLDKGPLAPTLAINLGDARHGEIAVHQRAHLAG